MESKEKILDGSIDKNLQNLSILFQDAIKSNGRLDILTANRILLSIISDYKEYSNLCTDYITRVKLNEKAIKTSEMMQNCKGDKNLNFKGLTDDLLIRLYIENNKNIRKICRVLKSEYNLEYSWSGVNKRIKQLYLK